MRIDFFHRLQLGQEEGSAVLCGPQFMVERLGLRNRWLLVGGTFAHCFENSYQGLDGEDRQNIKFLEIRVLLR